MIFILEHKESRHPHPTSAKSKKAFDGSNDHSSTKTSSNNTSNHPSKASNSFSNAKQQNSASKSQENQVNVTSSSLYNSPSRPTSSPSLSTASSSSSSSSSFTQNNNNNNNANTLQAALLQAAMAAAAASTGQFPYNLNQFYHPLFASSFQSSPTHASSYQLPNEAASSLPAASGMPNWLSSSRPLDSLYAAAALAAVASQNSATSSAALPPPPLNHPLLPSNGNQLNLLAAGVNMNLSNSFFLNQLAASSNLMPPSPLSLTDLKPKTMHEMSALAHQQYLYHPYSNQLQQFQVQQNQQTK